MSPDRKLQLSETETVETWTSDDPFDRAPESQAQLERIELSRDLIAGTKAMRDGGKKYLPIYPKELEEDWLARRDRTFLDPLYEETISEHVGRVFEEPIAIAEDLPEEIAAWLEDMDGEGSSVHSWAQRAFYCALVDGVVYGLVDQQALSAPVSTAEARERGVRPQAFAYPIDNVLGWRWRFEGGEVILTQARILDTLAVDEGAYGRRIEEQVIVYEPGSFVVWRKENSESDPAIEDEGTLAVDRVPLIPFVAGQPLSPFEAHPYFRQMAESMVEHWQRSSDQNHALAYVTRLLWHFRGFGEKEFEQIDSLGSNLKIRSSNKEASVDVVEPTGAGVELSQAALERLEQRLHRMSRRPLLTRPSGSLTATEAAIQTAIMQSSLRDLAVRFEAWLNRIVLLMAEHQGIELAGPAVSMPKTFQLQSSSDEIALLDKLGVSREVLFTEMRRRDMIDDALTFEDVFPDEDGEEQTPPPQVEETPAPITDQE